MATDASDFVLLAVPKISVFTSSVMEQSKMFTCQRISIHGEHLVGA